MKLKKSENAIPKKYNYGLALLKVILAYSVVCTHHLNFKSIENKILQYLFKERLSHVPAFFIMSFYFMYKDLLSSNIKAYLKRLERLLIPYILWPIIIFILNNYILYIFTIVQKFSFNDLIYQFIIGRGVLGILWFQWNLIMLTSLFFFIIYFCKNKYLFLIQIFGCFSYTIQYSGYNKKLINILRPEIKFTLGKFFESVPFASTGLTLASFQILNIIQKYKIQTLFFCLYIFVSLDKYSIIRDLKFSNSYSGLIFNVRAICLIFIFSLFPSNKITNIKIQKILKHITNYTPGVYYLHPVIRRYFKNDINHTLSGVFIIYLICYLICLIGMIFFGKTKLKYLF